MVSSVDINRDVLSEPKENNDIEETSLSLNQVEETVSVMNLVKSKVMDRIDEIAIIKKFD